MSSGLTMTDLFCGAGGSSTGARMAGLEVVTAANHWAEAVAVHQANFPDTDHDVADISQVSPWRYPRTEVLWASPECTTFSQAAPARPADAVTRSRATAFDVIRFAEHHADRGRPYSAIVCENVAEFAAWKLFPVWRQALEVLGYRLRVLHLNSAVANTGGDPAPQYRDRLYVVAWRSGRDLDELDEALSPHAACAACGPVRARQHYRTPVHRARYRGATGVSAGRYRFQYDYRCPGCHGSATPRILPAGRVLDLDAPSRPVLARGLVPRTLTRIRAGIDKFDARGARAFVMRNNGSRGDGREHCTSLEEPLRTLTTSAHQSLVQYGEPRAGRDRLEDASMRFLAPAEVARGMGFPPDYRFDATDTDVRTMLGNAVTPPAARDLLRAVAASLGA